MYGRIPYMTKLSYIRSSVKVISRSLDDYMSPQSNSISLGPGIIVTNSSLGEKVQKQISQKIYICLLVLYERSQH